MKFQLVTPYRVSHLQRYGVMARGNITVCTHLYLEGKYAKCSSHPVAYVGITRRHILHSTALTLLPPPHHHI